MTTYALTLVFKCRRCRQGDVVFTWQPTTRTFSLEGQCCACRALHQLGVDLVHPQPDNALPGE